MRRKNFIFSVCTCPGSHEYVYFNLIPSQTDTYLYSVNVIAESGKEFHECASSTFATMPTHQLKNINLGMVDVWYLNVFNVYYANNSEIKNVLYKAQNECFDKG